MTTQRPIRRGEASSQNAAPKPYELVPFPKDRPRLAAPIGHDRYYSDRWHGCLTLTLKVETAVHVSTGVVALGSDVAEQRVDLIKTMIQAGDRHPLIPGSSLKGVVRSIYEAITLSCICKTKAKRDELPDGYGECKLVPQQNQTRICPACQLFGALNLQGIIQFSDAYCQQVKFTTGFMPSLHRPHSERRQIYFRGGKAIGRKFYYHAIKAIDRGQQKGIPVQQAAKEYRFTTDLRFMNLSEAELGTLLIALGQDPKYPIALKVGAGKPIGMGTMTVDVSTARCQQNLQSRYQDYGAELQPLSQEQWQQVKQQAIAAAHRSLIQAPQLQAVADVLRYPTDREAPSGMY